MLATKSSKRNGFAIEHLFLLAIAKFSPIIVSKVAEPPDQFGIWEEIKTCYQKSTTSGCVGSASHS